MDNTLAQYKSYLTTLGYSSTTQRDYARAARDFLESAGGSYSRQIVFAYLATYADQSSTYRRWLMYALKSLFAFTRQPWPVDKREIPKLSKAQRVALTVDEVNRLIVASSENPLDRALLAVDSILGVRRKELSEMLVADYIRPNIRVRTAKGGEERVRYLGEDVSDIVDRYLETRRGKSPYLFVSLQGVHLSVQSLSIRFRRLADTAGIPKGVGWHGIRRGVVTWLYQAGMREKELQELFGWQSPVMPHLYVQLVEGEVDQKTRDMHPMLKGK